MGILALLLAIRKVTFIVQYIRNVTMIATVVLLTTMNKNNNTSKSKSNSNSNRN